MFNFVILVPQNKKRKILNISYIKALRKTAIRTDVVQICYNNPNCLDCAGKETVIIIL